MTAKFLLQRSLWIETTFRHGGTRRRPDSGSRGHQIQPRVGWRCVWIGRGKVHCHQGIDVEFHGHKYMPLEHRLFQFPGGHSCEGPILVRAIAGISPGVLSWPTPGGQHSFCHTPRTLHTPQQQATELSPDRSQQPSLPVSRLQASGVETEALIVQFVCSSAPI